MADALALLKRENFMSHKYASFLTLTAVAGFLPYARGPGRRAACLSSLRGSLRHAERLSGFRVVQGAERDRKLDIAMTIWVLKELPIAQTLDAKSNLAAQDRMKQLAASLRLIIPGHDPEVFARFPEPA